ncbi:phage tail protein I [Pseudoalteromonas luteoviolacea]|uniref:phage tail protein I n=1 Tax=Pseudoalteromonas luteoviolacea TaxID=43657 RepID=UPI001B35B329|nr:phage tail protein I [Pseudoalteromonas luteoviolacea]MBQ4814544.1 phage tail protein I [Pseudoalteromonas luteoviolacea]
MNKLLPSNATILTKALSDVLVPNNSVRQLLISLLRLSSRSDAQLVWLAKLCYMPPSEVLVNSELLLQSQTKHLLALIDFPEFCDDAQLNAMAAQLAIESWDPNGSDSRKRTQLKSACVLNDARLLISSLWDPFLCPTPLLPWLAWSVSVDEWDESWNEELKRQVISDAFAVHQVKGTPFALQKALDSLNIKTEIREWWQGENLDELPRGTVQVWALINSNLDEYQQGMLTPQMLKRVRRIVESVKRGSIHIDVQLGLAFTEQVGVVGAVSSAVFKRIDAPHGAGVKPPKFKQHTASIGAAETVQSGSLAISGKGVLPPKPTGVSSVCGATNSHQSGHYIVAANGVKPEKMHKAYCVSGALHSSQATHISVAGQGILPSNGTGNEYLVNVTRQIIYQHFNLQGAA